MIDDEQDRFDEFVRRAAQGYHRPPATPRDAIWARIERSRASHPRVLALHARRRAWWTVAAAIAAALVLGIAIGHSWPWHGPAGVTAVARAPRSRPIGPDTATPPTPAARGASTAVAVRPPHAASDAAGRDNTSTPLLAPRSRDARAYQVATIEHFGRVEALLTTFRAESQKGTVDPEVTAWAGDLLGTTRLLLDAPATRDPRMRKLLGDLEVVLAEIAQLRPQQDTTRDELQLIDQAVERHEMLLRLQSTIPTRTTLAGS